MKIQTISSIEWLTIAQAAQKLNCSESKIRNAVKQKKIKFFRDGKLIRIRQEDLNDYINERMIG